MRLSAWLFGLTHSERLQLWSTQALISTGLHLVACVPRGEL